MSMTVETATLPTLLRSDTGGKKLVVLVGQKKAVAIAVRKVSGRRRWSKLDEWLKGDGAEIAMRS